MRNKITLPILIGVCFAIALFIVFQAKAPKNTVRISPDNLHFIAITPELDSENSDFESNMQQLAQEYRFHVEIYSFSTVAEQKQMLDVVPGTNIDGILLWPISSNDSDYEAEVGSCKEQGIPVVVIDRDILPQLRSSYISSGATSDLLVLNQSLQKQTDKGTVLIGNRSGSGKDQTVELLLFSDQPSAGFDISQIHDIKLQQLAQQTPGGYVPCRYISYTGDDARPLKLKYELMNLLDQIGNVNLFFSLDNSLSASIASAKSTLGVNSDVELICYGASEDNYAYLKNGIIDGIIATKPDVSARIGLRYLRDICNGFWVPSSMDSGIVYQNRESISDEAVAEDDSHE